MKNYAARLLWKADLAYIAAQADNAAFFVDYGLKYRSLAFVTEGVEASIEAVDAITKLLLRGMRNPPLPETPAEWVLLMEEAAKVYWAHVRVMRRAKRRITKALFATLERKRRKLEEALVLRARVMREQFLSRWPRSWTDALDGKIRVWYGKRLR